MAADGSRPPTASAQHQKYCLTTTCGLGVVIMRRFLTGFALSAVVICQASIVAAGNEQTAAAHSELKAATVSSDLPPLPPAPRGNSTTVGGEIRKVDPVLDQFTLAVFGQRPIKIFFDERTEVYRDGKRIPLHDLGPSGHASVQTILDGTDVFAMSVHMLTQLPEGECTGQCLVTTRAAAS